MKKFWLLAVFAMLAASTISAQSTQKCYEANFPDMSHTITLDIDGINISGEFKVEGEGLTTNIYKFSGKKIKDRFSVDFKDNKAPQVLSEKGQKSWKWITGKDMDALEVEIKLAKDNSPALVPYIPCESENDSLPRMAADEKTINSRATYLPAPEYPKTAKAVGAKGSVEVEVVVDEEGNVISATALSGHSLLQPAAVEAARRAKFKPLMRAGKPSKFRGTVVYNFTK